MSKGNRSNATAAPIKKNPAPVATKEPDAPAPAVDPASKGENSPEFKEALSKLNPEERARFDASASESTGVAKIPDAPLKQMETPPAVANALAGDDTGFEGMDASHFVIPYLGILQPLSPQVLEAKEQYISGAKAGMLYNSVTNRIFDGKQGVRFIPVHVQHQQVEWVPRDQGGQLIARHEVDEPAVIEARKKFPVGKAPFGDGNELIETFYVYGLMVEPDGRFERVVLSFKSTDINEYKKWMTKARSVQKIGTGGAIITPPMYSHFFRLRTVAKNKNNYDWYGWAVRFDGESADATEIPEDSQIYREAKDFRALAKTNRVRTADTTVTNEGEDNTDEL